MSFCLFFQCDFGVFVCILIIFMVKIAEILVFAAQMTRETRREAERASASSCWLNCIERVRACARAHVATAKRQALRQPVPLPQEGGASRELTCSS